jgi:hypothetical protein
MGWMPCLNILAIEVQVKEGNGEGKAKLACKGTSLRDRDLA